MATKPKRPSFVSPKGTFKYPALTKPDFGNEKFPKPDGEFKSGLVVPLEDAQDLIDKLTPLHAQALLEGAEEFKKLKVEQRKKLGKMTEQPFYETEYDPETEQETGNVIFKTKCKYKIKSKDGSVSLNKVPVFDAKGKPMAAGAAIYGGTVGKLSFQVLPYFVAGQGMAGITLRLTGAQVIDLVGPGARSASSLGFGEEEGYEADGSEAPFEVEGTSDGAADGNPQDF